MAADDWQRALRRQFGMQEGQFKRFYKEAMRRKGVTGELLLQLLETRLDNLVYRLGFAPSRRAARALGPSDHWDGARRPPGREQARGVAPPGSR